MKKCDVCNSKVGLLDNYIKTKDKKIIGKECAVKVFNDYNSLLSSSAIGDWGYMHSLNDFIELLENNVNTSIRECVKRDKEKAKVEKDKEKARRKKEREKAKIVKEKEQNKELESIKEQLKECNVTDTFFTKREIKMLPQVLDANESIKYVTSGYWGNRTVLMVCTNKRIIFINKNMIYGTSGSNIPLNSINAVSYKTGLVLAEIHITNGADTIIVEQIEKNTVKPMVEAIKNAKEALESPTDVSSSNNDVAEQIRKFKKLMDDNIITEEEFEQKKKQLLNL